MKFMGAWRFLIPMLPLILGGGAYGQAQTSFTNTDYVKHIRGLKEKLPHKGFTIVLEKPFVDIGDMEAA